MSNTKNSLAQEAQRILDILDGGKTYTSGYIVSRFEKASSDHSTDQLIGHMKDVLVKKAKSQEFFKQSEITALYDQMYGLSGGQSAFRVVLSDLLSEDHQISEASHKGSNIRKMEEKSLSPFFKNTEMSDAYAAAFSLGGANSFATFNPKQDSSVVKAVVAKLASLGYTPVETAVVQQNDHFALCVASFNTPSFKKVAVKIPVQITNGMTHDPEVLIDGDKTIKLSKDNLYLNIKALENELKQNSHKKLASMRADDTPAIITKKVTTPKALESFVELESTLLAATSRFDSNQIQVARNMLSSELISFGAFQPDIKIANSEQKGIVFSAYIPTEVGKTVIHVPVEIVNGKPMIPSKFAVDMESGKHKVYDFSRSGYNDFIVNISPKSQSLTVARHTGELSRMSHQELVDRIIEGVSSQDYKLSEDALAVIEQKFGTESFKKALDQFTRLLKHSSTNSSTRKTFIEQAIKRGELITVPTSVELYAPKLGLPLSKISFDEKGRLVPKGRREKSDNNSALISTNQIILT